MTKTLTCRDIGMECDMVFEGETDDEIMEKAKKHAADSHGLSIPPGLEKKCRAAIKEKTKTKKEVKK